MRKIVLFITILTVFATSYAQLDSLTYTVSHLDKINTAFSDFGVSKYGDKVVLASTRKDLNLSAKTWKGNKQPHLDLFIGTIDSVGEIILDKNIGSLNTKYHESNAVFTKDLKTVYFTRSTLGVLGRNRTGFVQIFRATVNNGSFDNIELLPFSNKNFDTGHPALNADETKLYFSSTRPGGYGKSDIWVVDINDNGSFGKPVNLGKEINSAVKEMFPYITSSGKLYFSSEKSGGIGGLDIYVSQSLADNKFSKAINIGNQINSNRDDFAFSIDEATSQGYFSSNRSGGKGDDDIYYFKIKEPDPICDQKVQGLVTDKNHRKLLPGTTVVLYQDKVEIDRMVVGEDARYEFSLGCDTEFNVIATKKKYGSVSETFKSGKAGLDLAFAINLDLQLPPKHEDFIRKGDQWMVKINPIYFDYDKAYITEEARLELQKVIKVMKQYPDIIIESGSHTDARGSSAYNQKLSERRAASTVNYILKAGGINPNRITYKGYGETRLTNNCTDNGRHTNTVRCSEVQHQLNRRTEFVIVNPEVIYK